MCSKWHPLALNTSPQSFHPLVYCSVRSPPRPSPIAASAQPYHILASCTLVPACSPKFCSSGPDCTVATNPVKLSLAFPDSRNQLLHVCCHYSGNSADGSWMVLICPCVMSWQLNNYSLYQKLLITIQFWWSYINISQGSGFFGHSV